MSQRRIAAFDLDGTFHRGTQGDSQSLGHTVIRQLIREGKKKDPFVKQDEVFAAYDRRQVKFHDYLASLEEDMETRFFSGLKREDAHAAAHKIVERELHRTYVFTRELLLTLKELGYVTVAITGSYYGIAVPFAKAWGFDHVFASELEADENGIYYGTPDRATIHARNKGEVLKGIVERESLTFDGSIAVGDAMSDASMLKVVKHPILFNPNDQLLEAFEYGTNAWLVLERRVIYYKELDLSPRVKGHMLPPDVLDRLAWRLETARQLVKIL